MACFIILFNQLSGSGALFVLAATVFPQVVGWQPEVVLRSFCYLTFLQVAVTFLAGQFLEKYGRRSFMLEGQRVIIVALVLTAFLEFAAPEYKGFQFVLIFVHIVGFSLSFGPCSFLVDTELLQDITYPSMLFWVLNFLLGLITPSLLYRYGPAKLLAFYAVASFVGLLYIGGYLVETQGKSRQQVYE